MKNCKRIVLFGSKAFITIAGMAIILLACQGNLDKDNQSSSENCDAGDCIEDHGRIDREPSPGTGEDTSTLGTTSTDTNIGTGDTGSDEATNTNIDTGESDSDEATDTDTGDIPPGVAPEGFLLVPALGGVGIEWQLVEGADSYNVYFSTSPGVMTTTGTLLSNVQRNFVHRDVTDRVTYYYAMTAVIGGVEGPLSEELFTTPGGEYGLHRFGNGDMPDLLGNGGAWVPVEERVHVLLLGDGYLADEMDNYAQDVEEYIDDILTKPIYWDLRETFVFWSMPVVSEGRVGDNSAWGLSSQPQHTDLTVLRIWEAIRKMPYEPSGYFEGWNSREPKNIIVGMMAANNGSSGFSGYMTTITEPGSSPTTRVRVGFFHGRAHEFSHAFGYLSDEYYNVGHNSASSSETSNVFNDATCENLPWEHLLFGSEFNPGVDQLVGAFGVRENDPRLDGTGVTSNITRVHSELKCHINGAHDNSLLYGGRDNLRVGRFCNWCRELLTYAAFERTGIVDDQTGWDTWKQQYRTGFYEVIGFQTPDTVPQENSLGVPYFDACEPASVQ